MNIHMRSLPIFVEILFKNKIVANIDNVKGF